MTEPTIVRTETCKFLSYRDDKQTNVREVELELIARLLPYLWNEDEDKISFAVVCEDKPGLLLEVHYPDGVVPGSLEASLLLKRADELRPVKFWFTQGDHLPNGCYARRAFIPIEIATFDYADKVYKHFKEL
jgi:hypothetical protein